MIKIPEIIVAVDCNGGFGKEGGIPWNISEDLEHFKRITTGHVCAMGRRTFNDILDRRVAQNAVDNNHAPIDHILPGRESYVITRNVDFQAPGATRCSGLGTLMSRLW